MGEANSRPEDPISGQVAQLVDLIEYQEASVVTRALVDRTAATVTLFAFDEGEGLSEHSAPFDALVFVIEGRARVTVSGVAHDVAAGQVLLMPANEPHGLRAATRFKMLLMMVRA